MIRRPPRPASLLLFLAAALLSSCRGEKAPDLRVLASTGMEDLDPILSAWASSSGRRISLDHLGALDMAAEISRAQPRWDAVWSPAGLWLSGIPKGKLGDLEPTMSSPLVWGLSPEAAALFPQGSPLSTRALADAAIAGKIKLLIPDPLRTGAGAGAALSLIHALSSASGALEAASLTDARLKDRLQALMPGLTLAEGDEESAAEALGKGVAQALAISEYALIRWNETAPDEKKLRAAYPSDGTFLEDGPLARLLPAAVDDKSRTADRAIADLQAWLRSAEGREALTAAGRRAWLGGATLNPKPLVFDPAWGIDTGRELAVLRQPRPEVAAAALSLLEESRRGPVLAILCLDFSSSMKSGGKEAMINALKTTLVPPEGAILPPPPFLDADRIAFLPFAGADDGPFEPSAPRSPLSAAEALGTFADLDAKGSSDVFGAARRALAFAEGQSREGKGLRPAIVILGDGKDNDGKFGPFALDWKISRSKPPVSAILLGKGDPKQVKAMADLSGGSVLDGSLSIAGAIRDILSAR